MRSPWMSYSNKFYDVKRTISIIMQTYFRSLFLREAWKRLPFEKQALKMSYLDLSFELTQRVERVNSNEHSS